MKNVSRLNLSTSRIHQGINVPTDNANDREHRHKMNIKCQMPIGYKSTNSLIESGIESDDTRVVTFHAFSPSFKAAVLERIASGTKIKTMLTTDEPRSGEWLEEEMDSLRSNSEADTHPELPFSVE